MQTITIPKKEYQKLKAAERKLGLLNEHKVEEKSKNFNHAAFGILKGTFGKESSVEYVRKLRKQWRA